MLVWTMQRLASHAAQRSKLSRSRRRLSSDEAQKPQISQRNRKQKARRPVGSSEKLEARTLMDQNLDKAKAKQDHEQVNRWPEDL